MLKEYLKFATGSLSHRKTRSWLTLIGIFIGITAVVALVSLGQGLEYSLTAEFLELGADKIQISARGPTFGSGDVLANSLRERDLRAIEQTQGVSLVSAYRQQTARLTWGKDQVAFYTVGGVSTDDNKLKVVENYLTLKIAEGRSLKTGDRAKGIAGYQLTNPDNLEKPLKIGDKVTVNGTSIEIIGTYESMGDPSIDATLFVPIDTYNEIFGNKDLYDVLVVQVNEGTDPEIVAEDLTIALRNERGLEEGDEDFNVQTPKELVESFGQVFAIVQFVLLGIAGISLLVGGVGIMNTMYTAVLERTKEIGIMKAIGATNRAIATIFVIESGLLGLLGGLIGLLSGLALAKSTEYIGKAVLDTDLLKALVPWWLVVGSLMFAFIVGVLSGVLPAYQASKQKPVDSLRYE
jgi:putative ABC transport system permease protein